MLKQVSESWSDRNLNFKAVEDQIRGDMEHKGISHYFLKRWVDFMEKAIKKEEKGLGKETDVEVGRKINEKLASFFHT